MTDSDQPGFKFGPFWIKPGLTRLNVAAVLFGSFSTIGTIVAISLLQPYILNEIAHIPMDQQGTVTGRLSLLQEFVTILLVGLMGAWSDRIGRRFIYVAGFVILGAGYFVYPFATSEAELAIYRLVFAVGVAMVPVMLSTMVQDTPQEQSRGRWLGVNVVAQGLGVLLIATVVLSQAPAWFAARGFDPIMAGRMAFWTTTVFCIIAALVLRLSLASGVPGGVPGGKQRVSIFTGLRQGISRSRHNPRLALAFGASFVGRGDLVIVGSFLTLWITQAGIEQGLTTAEAVALAGKTFGMVQLSAILFAYAMGMIADRVNRVTGLCIALTMAAVSYTAMGLFADPFDGSMIPFAILVGSGEISVIVATGALLGQEAGWKNRGAVIGAGNLIGAIGMMTVGYFGGIIYDGISRTAPFTVMGILNGCLLIVALFVRYRWGTLEEQTSQQDKGQKNANETTG